MSRKHDDSTARRSNRDPTQPTSSAPQYTSMHTRGRPPRPPSPLNTHTTMAGRGRASAHGPAYHLSSRAATSQPVPPMQNPPPPAESFQRPVTDNSQLEQQPTEQQPTAQQVPRPDRRDTPLSVPAIRPVTARDDLHPHWYIRAVVYLIAYAHTRHRVTFRACALFLLCLGFIFSVIAGNLLGAVSMPRTLKTVFSKLDIRDKFDVHPICFRCHRIFEPYIEPDAFCPDCDEEIFGSPNSESQDSADWEDSDVDFDFDLGSRETASSRRSTKRKPYVVAPIQRLSVGLRQFFKRPGMLPAVNAWKKRRPSQTELNCMQDGNVWKTIKGPDHQSFFFGPQADDEVRLGVSFSLDWFSKKKSDYGSSHSAGVMSFCIQNLTTSLRYRAENLILSGMPPGPTEPTADQLQNYLKIIVDDLLMLYDEGILVETPEHPNGIRVRVALVAIIADHPAMVKLCGFADHGHNVTPCTKCKVNQKDFFTTKSLRNEFPARDGEEHRQLCIRYRNLRTLEEKKEFFAKYGARWSEFARLLYFDLVRYTIIDPMHNLLLGVAKTQWYTRWIKCGTLRGNTQAFTRELNIVHEFLETFESPSWAGRLPLRVGEPAGGSLTADEYKFAVSGPWAVVIPIVWERFFEESESDYQKAASRYPKTLEAYNRKLDAWERGNRTTNPPAAPAEPARRMQEGEDTNFLRFATALKILVGSSITFQGLEKAKRLLRDYLLNFSRLYGKDAMRPNHHWAVHIPDQVLDYGPLYSFWAFLTERLNKVLKNLNTNNWNKGLLEVSMMREFHRTAQLDGLLNRILEETSGPNESLLVQLEHKFLQILLGAGQNTEILGTIQDAAVHDRSGDRVSPGTIASKAELIEDDIMRLGLLNHYNKKGPKVHLPRMNPLGARTKMLAAYAEIYDFALLDGRRITPTSRSKGGSAKSALIQVTLNEKAYVGEIQAIFRHDQPGIPGSQDTLLVYVKWLKRSTLTPLNDNKFIWGDEPDFKELGVDTWKCDIYAHPSDPNLDSPPFVIPLSEVQCQAARGRIKFTKPPIWITTTMDRYPTSLAAFGMGDAIEEE